MRYDARIAVEPKRELGEVVAADGHPVEEVEELFGEDDIARYLAHHIDWLFNTMLRHDVEDLFRFRDRAAEGNHRDDVRKPHLVPHLHERAAFKYERILELRVVITAGAAPAEHRILL